jgi:hypothetical protein
MYTSSIWRTSHAQQTHLPPQRTGSDTALLASIARGISVNVPVSTALGAILATLLLTRGSAAPSPHTALKTHLRSRARVPPKGARDGVKPLGICAQDSRERVLRGRNGDMVAASQLYAALAVESAISGRAAGPGDGNAQEHRVGENHGPEGEGVRADWRQENGRQVRMDQRAAG